MDQVADLLAGAELRKAWDLHLTYIKANPRDRNAWEIGEMLALKLHMAGVSR